MRGNVPGQVSRATSSYCCGASQVFERDCYGSEAQASICYPCVQAHARPHSLQVLTARCRPDRNTTAESAKVLNNAAELIRGAFGWAKDYAFVDGCVGVEFPLKTPPVAGNISLLEVRPIRYRA